MTGDAKSGIGPVAGEPSRAPVISPAPSRLGRLLELLDSQIPEELLIDPETTRRARLIARFGMLGAFFGAVYATFYLLIGHVWGALIIVICSVVFGIAPFLMRRQQMINPAGNLLILILTLGFTALCFVEGGLSGHAIAWLVSVPLCAFLMLGQAAATRWAIIAFLAASGVAGADLAGIKLPVTYDPKWTPVVSTAGYLGLIIFMFFLGLIFESSRARAFSKMEDALTELARSNDQLAHINDRLVHLNNEKNEFLGIAAHDLKNPLTIIMGSAEVAAMLDEQEDVHKMLGNISDAAVRMRNLINDLLDVHAIEEGKFASRLEPVDMGALVEECVTNNRPGAEKKMINLVAHTTVGLWAKGDRAATRQILENLISNALKFSSPLTSVQVQAVAESGKVAVTVRDEGPGLSEEDRKKLFKKYSRLTARPTGGESSTGLGLAIVKRLVEAMLGTIECESELGAGAAFILRLPACEPGDGGLPPEK